MFLKIAAGFLLGVGLFAPAALAAKTVELAINVDSDAGAVDEKIYGHFLEHIYHSVNGGLWGELIWNRSFEQFSGTGLWTLDGDTLIQSDLRPDVRLSFGNAAWTDYTYSVEAMKTGGNEGFLVLFRNVDQNNFYWLNLGGWGNTKHAIERSRQGNKTIVGPSVPGTIEAGKWYRIEIRCAGPRISVSVDGHKLMDIDDPQGLSQGRVGVGTWATAAKFRNFKVTDVQGRELQGARPELPPTLAAKWASFGKPANCGISREKPLNGEYCQYIASDGTESGLQQSGISVKAGEGYGGSLWVRGQGGLLRAVLSGPDGPIATADLGSPAAEWREMPFEFKPDKSVANAAFRVELAGKGQVWLDQVSMRPVSSAKTAGCRSDLYKAVADLRPPIIRWPGGCFAEYYRWKSGVGPQNNRVKYPITIWDDQDVNSYGTDEFVAMCRQLGTEPMLVINIGRHDPNGKQADYIKEACEWVEYCNGPADSEWGKVRAANGHRDPYNVKYWEIDNETWQMGPKAYAEAVKAFVPALKKVDSSIRVAVCGGSSFDTEWNRGVIAGCAEFADYLSIHHYEDPARYADGPRKYEEFIRKTGETIAASANPKMKLFVSEWNAQSTDWRTGLYAGGVLNVFERCSNIVEIASPALFLRHVSATEWDNAFINFDAGGWFPAPNYVVMKLWRDHYGARRLEVSGDAAGVDVSATKAADGKQVFVKLVNATSEPVELRVSLGGRVRPGEVSIMLVAADSLSARNTLTQPSKIAPISVPVEMEGKVATLALPRWSAGVLTARIK